MPAAWTQGLRSELIPWFEWILSYAQYYDPSARVSSAYRSNSEQSRLYRRFLLGLMPGPVAPPGQSKHELGRAIDIWTVSGKETPAINAALSAAGAAWESVGGIWGGHFKTVGSDPIHFEA